MRSLPPSPVFGFEQALAAGWTMSGLRHAVHSGRLVRVRRGVYVIAGEITRGIEDRAAAIAYPDLPLSTTSAARLFGIPLVATGGTRIEMTVTPTGNADIPGVHPYRARLRDHELIVVDGILVTSPARTVCDIARHYPRLTAVTALDHVLHRKLATADELLDVLDFCRAWPGAPRARWAAQLCDSRSESPFESLSRLVIPRLGLPVPEPQVEIYDEDGVFVGRGDFYWDGFGVIGEADGHGKYDDGRAVLLKEKDREMRLEDTGAEVVRWYWVHAWSQHDVLTHRLQRGYERGAARDRAGLTRRWTAEPTARITVL